MNRKGHIFEQIVDIENLRNAAHKARKGKKPTASMREYDKDPEGNLLALQQTLIAGTFKTSPYRLFTIHDPKEREISCLPYYPDKVAHHAFINILEPIYERQFTADTYSCIKKRGIHACANAVKRQLREDPEGTRYCLKIDIRKFYPNIDHAILKQMHRRIIKDRRVLEWIDELIDSTEGEKGIPIGNDPSRYFSNYYLSPLDHWLKEEKHVRHYSRYMDDIVIFGATKDELHRLLAEMREYLQQYKLQIKDNYQVFPTDARGVDFVGYVFRHTHTRMRKSVKQRLARKVALLNRQGHRISEQDYRNAIAPWWGWAKHCNSIHLINKLSKGATYDIEF